MADELNLDKINTKLSELSESLDAIKTQSALNIGDTSRILNNLGMKLENIEKATTDDEIQELIADVKHSLSDKYSYITVKFTELETAIRDVVKNNDDLATIPQIKELFDILTTNISVFSKQVMAQGDILNEITLRIEALRTDDTKKHEIIKSINSVKADIEKFNNGFESIILNVNNNFESTLEHISKLDPTAEVSAMSKAISDMKNTSDSMMTAVQVVDQKQNKLNDAIDEVVVQNTKINANIKALAGQSDFDGLVKKIESSIELINTLKTTLTDANEQSQKSLLVQLDKLSVVVTKILTEEDFAVFKNELSELVNNVIESTNVLRGDLLSTTSEFNSLVKLVEGLNLTSSYDSLRSLVESSTREIKSKFAEVLTVSGLEPLRNDLSTIVQNIEQMKATLNFSIDKNADSSDEKLNTVLDLADKIREVVTTLPDTIKQNLAFSDAGRKTALELCSKDISSVLTKLGELQQEISRSLTPLSGKLDSEVQQLKDIALELKKVMASNEDVITRMTGLEALLGRTAGDYDVALHSVQKTLLDYMSKIKNDCESADIKMNNFAFEFNSLKSQFDKSMSDFSDSIKGKDERFNQVCNAIATKFDDVMEKLDVVVQQPQSIEGIKNDFDDVQHTMQDILLVLSDIKVRMSSSRSVSDSESAEIGNISDESFVKFESKINKIKDQLNFVSSDIIQNLCNNAEAIRRDLEPIQSAVHIFADIDFQNVAQALKEQIDLYHQGLDKLSKEVASDESRPILNDIFAGFGSLENKMIAMEKSVRDFLANSLTEVKLEYEKAKSVTQGQYNVENGALGTDIEDLLDSKIVDLKETLFERFENVHHHLDNVVVPKLDEIKTQQDDVLSNLTDAKEQINSVKSQLNELFGKISGVQEDVLNSQFSVNPISEEKLGNMGEEEKSIIVDFTNNLSELANLVKYTSDKIDERISRAFSENSMQFDFEQFKTEISQMLSSVQTKANVIPTDVDVESVQVESGLQGKLEEYKAQILCAVQSVKDIVSKINIDSDVAENIRIISQKIDLISSNDDYKSSIDASLQEIRNTVADQKKFLNAINILEVLANLEDINKLKGIENLSKLSEIISVEKLNSLNKLNLLDKLKNLDCLDELQKIPKLSGMIELQEELRGVITGLDQKLNLFSKNYSAMDIFAEEFKNELTSAKTAIMKHVLNVFEQLSFVVEGEEIKDFVDEKTQSILNALSTNNNEQLNQEIKTIKHAIDSLKPLEYKDVEENIKTLNTISEKIDSVPNSLETQVNIMKQQLNKLRTGSEDDDDSYIYSMQDVESDIARLRVALDEVKKVVETNSLKEIADYVNEIVRQVDSMKFNINQDDIFKMKVDIERITSDVVSISSRTNKLLLASDESANALNLSMQSFRDTISDLYEGLKKMDYSEMTEKLEKMDNSVIENTKQQNNTLEAVAKLTIWSENAEEKLSDVSETLSKLKKSMPSNETVLDELETKFAKQQQRIDSLEEKLDELLSMSNDRDSSVMSKKLTDIEKQLTRLNRSIERLTSYVDEE